MSRSVWKGPFVDPSLIKKVEKLKLQPKPTPIKTWSRKSTIIPEFIGVSFLIYNGKKFILAKVPTDSWANNGKISFIQNNVQPGSFIFGHSNIVNGLPFRNRASRAKDYQKRTELLQLLTTTNSMYINGHMHVFYPMIFREQGFQAKNIFVGSMADKNGITGSDGKYQPNSIAVFDVGSGVTINAFIYENGNFRQFSSADAQKYFPQNNQFTNHIQPLPLGGVIS